MDQLDRVFKYILELPKKGIVTFLQYGRCLTKDIIIWVAKIAKETSYLPPEDDRWKEIWVSDYDIKCPICGTTT